MLRDMVISGANNIEQYKEPVNELNVFPVPDGDTGTNMSLTMSSAGAELQRVADKNAGEVAKITASATLKGARGNSGVILSLLFRGFAKGLADCEEIDGVTLAEALGHGVAAAYKAVMKPTEGTILTVARVSAEKAQEVAAQDNDPLKVFERLVEVAKEVLAETPEMLPVLKQAGVVDSGGRGLIYIYEGMLSVLRDGVIIKAKAPQENAQKANFASFDSADIRFAYCTEFIIHKEHSNKVRNPEALRQFLESNGDSVVFAEDDDIIKVHVHSNKPGRMLQEALKYGYLTNMKIENMIEQLAEKASEMQSDERVVAAPEKPIGFVAVSAGEGITSVLRDLMVDEVVFGGQTMNPSTEDILKAVDKTPAECVFVLPNNKNIIMAAEMAQKIEKDKRIVVLPTKTMPEGISAMLAFDESLSVEENEQNMREAIKGVKTGLVTYAVRDSVTDGKKIKQGEIIGLHGGHIGAVTKSIEKTALELVKQMVDESASFMTIFYGADVKAEDAERLHELLTKRCGDRLEVTLVPGGQPVYYYIISVE
ncbi:DAK2 domain-containing protein [Feifania hominis]|uniref:DAK2 domain-containing protein n=1 Tax=Feifania hominis TaxID=2763660 RepID=A0A926HU95_9FIRM|nr:DAK2 domain-containing protein [Feifania hominis]MBC8536073.1 DAK2 domain-containing protein [Feifania hominis]